MMQEITVTGVTGCAGYKGLTVRHMAVRFPMAVGKHLMCCFFSLSKAVHFSHYPHSNQSAHPQKIKIKNLRYSSSTSEIRFLAPENLWFCGFSGSNRLHFGSTANSKRSSYCSVRVIHGFLLFSMVLLTQ
jgi:hypothetical protein